MFIKGYRTLFFPLAAASVLLICRCTGEIVSPAGSAAGDSLTTITGSLEQPGSVSRTSLGSDDKVYWVNGDAISVFTSSGANACFTTTLSSPSVSASFSGTASGRPEFIMYPYMETSSIDDGIISFTKPQVQQYAGSSFASGSNLAVGCVEGDLFVARNLFGILELTLTGTDTVTEILLTSSAGNALWGDYTVNPHDASSLAFVDGTGGDSIVLDCGDGVALSSAEGTKFVFVVPAGSLAGGFTAVVSAGSREARLFTTKDIPVSRSCITPMSSRAIVTYAKTISFSVSAQGDYPVINSGTEEDGD